MTACMHTGHLKNNTTMDTHIFMNDSGRKFESQYSVQDAAFVGWDHVPAGGPKERNSEQGTAFVGMIKAHSHTTASQILQCV